MLHIFFIHAWYTRQQIIYLSYVEEVPGKYPRCDHILLYTSLIVIKREKKNRTRKLSHRVQTGSSLSANGTWSTQLQLNNKAHISNPMMTGTVCYIFIILSTSLDKKIPVARHYSKVFWVTRYAVLYRIFVRGHPPQKVVAPPGVHKSCARLRGNAIQGVPLFFAKRTRFSQNRRCGASVGYQTRKTYLGRTTNG